VVRDRPVVTKLTLEIPRPFENPSYPKGPPRTFAQNGGTECDIVMGFSLSALRMKGASNGVMTSIAAPPGGSAEDGKLEKIV
jgi:hypothetical protein